MRGVRAHRTAQGRAPDLRIEPVVRREFQFGRASLWSGRIESARGSSASEWQRLAQDCRPRCKPEGCTCCRSWSISVRAVDGRRSRLWACLAISGRAARRQPWDTGRRSPVHSPMPWTGLRIRRGKPSAILSRWCLGGTSLLKTRPQRFDLAARYLSAKQRPCVDRTTRARAETTNEKIAIGQRAK